MRDIYKPKGREAHSGHLCKVGQAWKEDFVQVFVEDPAAQEHKLFQMPDGNRVCEKCGEVIRYDTRGYAFCQCKIWNEANQYKESQLARMIKLDKIKNFCKA